MTCELLKQSIHCTVCALTFLGIYIIYRVLKNIVAYWNYNYTVLSSQCLVAVVNNRPLRYHRKYRVLLRHQYFQRKVYVDENVVAMII